MICPICKRIITKNMDRTVRKVNGIFQVVHRCCQDCQGVLCEKECK